NAAIPLSAAVTVSGTTTIKKVDFLRTGTTTPIATVTAPPYTASWVANVAAGSYSITARATDNTNATKTSSAVPITITANTAPAVSITQPANLAKFGWAQEVTVSANASDADGIASVEFFSKNSSGGVTSLGIAPQTSQPYSVSYVPSVAGSFTLMATATDGRGGQKTATVSITVLAAPTATITAPANNATVTLPANATATATAATGATITDAELIADDQVSLGFVTAKGPYTWPLAGLTGGPHVLQV